MKIPHLQQDGKFRLQIRENLDTRNTSDILRFSVEETGGYNGSITLTIADSKEEEFEADISLSDHTRFPASIRAVATELRDHGFLGQFVVEHIDGQMCIERKNSIVGENESDFLKACCEQPDSRTTNLARKIYDALRGSEVFDIVYVVQDTRYVAKFLGGEGDEICRVVAGRGESGGRTYSGVWICKRRNWQDAGWSPSRTEDFQRQFGFEALAGHTMIKWCDENRDRVNELLNWFVAQAVGDNSDAQMMRPIIIQVSSGLSP